MFTYCQLYWKDENKERGAGNGPFFKKRMRPSLCTSLWQVLKYILKYSRVSFTWTEGLCRIMAIYPTLICTILNVWDSSWNTIIRQCHHMKKKKKAETTREKSIWNDMPQISSNFLRKFFRFCFLLSPKTSFSSLETGPILDRFNWSQRTSKIDYQLVNFESIFLNLNCTCKLSLV